MNWVAAIAVIIATIIAMEFVAWASHKYIMHGFGWGWHRDHHEPHNNMLEKNDLFGIVGAAMSISMFVLGALGTGFAYIWNFRNIKLAGSTIASTVTYITPVVAVVLGLLFLGEALSFNALVGGILVLLSALLVQKRLRLLTRRP